LRIVQGPPATLAEEAVDVLDVRLCLQIATGILEGTAEQRTAADVDKDGDVDMDDATLLAQHVIGL